MAITLVTKPDYYIRAYDTNTAYYKISSTKTTELNFRFVLKLYGPTNNYLATIKLTSDSSGYGYYNPTSYINSFLTSNVNINSNILTDCTSSYGLYTLQFGEEYGDPIVTYSGLTSDVRFYYNGCQIFEDYDTLYNNNYWVAKTGITTGHFLTPTNKFYLDLREKMWLYWINSNLSGDTYFVFRFYYQGTNTDVTVYTYQSNIDKMYSVGVGPANLVSGSTPTNWDYYTIDIEEPSSSPSISGYTIYNTYKCNYNDFTSVYWLNEHGGWSNFLFNKKKYNEYKVTRNTYEKFLNYGYTNQQRGLTQFRTDVEQTISLNTDWLNDYQNLLIKSLFMSPDVRIYENGTLIPYMVVDTEYNERSTTYDGKYQYQVKLTPANKKVIQYG